MNFKNFDKNELKKEFNDKTKPFKFIIIDNLFDIEILQKIETEIRNYSHERMIDSNKFLNKIIIEYDNETRYNKKVIDTDIDEISINVKYIENMMNSYIFISFIEEITGINNLKIDPNNFRSGIHSISKDGKLAIHTDFNYNIDINKYTAITIILFLNSDWKPSYNGELELWNPDMSECIKSIPPIINRLVIFTPTKNANHGVPSIWNGSENYSRLSFAKWLYTDKNPEEERDIESAIFKKRYNLEY